MIKYLLTLIICFNFIQAQTKWTTKFEESGYVSTSSYDETVEYFQAIADYSELAELITIGISPQGRELKCLIVSKDKIFNHQRAEESDNAIILINNGIHSGEIEGKDACMLMLREMLITGEKEHLLENVILLVIPVFNLDGHERSSPYNRINQNGPTAMGWRTTAQNYNLNRDFTKADSPEMKALLSLFSKWLPDIFIDNHTTDGADYQYSISYSISKNLDVPPVIREIVNNEIIPSIEQGVNDAGYLISPYAGFIKGDYNMGIRDWISSPRFSNGYGSVQNRIGLLIETHMLKPYKDRVFSTKALLESVINYSSENSIKLNLVSQKADEYIMDYYTDGGNAYPAKFKIVDGSDKFNFKGFRKEYYDSNISGSKIVKYTNEKTEKLVPYHNKTQVVDSVYLPYAYIIPIEWNRLTEIMKLHGIKFSQIEKNKKVIVERMKFRDIKFTDWTYEGRTIPSFKYSVYKDTITSQIGDFLVPTRQRSLGMIIHLLEPKFIDSFVKWGFMNIIFERKEYFESYSMEPIAREMYDENEEIRKEFSDLLASDTSFAANPRARLNFFYKKSPYFDQQLNVYPILRVLKIVE